MWKRTWTTTTTDRKGQGMDGYVILVLGADALALYDRDPRVRYAASLDTGEGFAAFDQLALGDNLGAEIERVLFTDQAAMPWWWVKVRWLAATPDDRYALMTAQAFAELHTLDFVAATPIEGDMVLVQSIGHDVPGEVLWRARAVTYQQRSMELTRA